MEYLRLFETMGDYNNEEYNLPYPCVSTTKENDKVVIYEPKPSWVRCTYNLTDAFADGTESITIFNNNPKIINGYKVNGVRANVEPERVEDGVQVEVFQLLDINGQTAYFPTVDACPLGSELTTATTFTLSRALQDDDVVYMIQYSENTLYRGDTMGTVGELKSAGYFDMYFTFSNDTTYSYSQAIVDLAPSEMPNYGLGIFFADKDYNGTAMPSLVTTMIGRKVTGGITTIELTSSDVNEDGLVTIEYTLKKNINKISSKFNSDYLIKLDLSGLNKKGKYAISSDAFKHCTSLTSITTSDYLTSIEDYAFYDCSSLISIDIPKRLTSIGNHAFEGCVSLTSITIPDSVISIGNSVFSDCSKLESVALGKGLTTIPSSGFAFCTSLSKINIPNTITSISDHAFWWCINLPIYDNIRYADTCLVSVADKTLTTYSIKEGTKFIHTSAFQSCDSLTNIEIPDGVINIPDYCFKQCTNLSRVNLPNSITYIGGWAFHVCSSLVNINIPDSVTSINSGAFSECTSLPVIDNIRYADTCLVEVVDKTLTTYSIKEGTKFIHSDAFSDCINLTSITIPESVISMIGNHIFANCNNLAEIISHAIIAPPISTWTSLNEVAENGTLYYPKGSDYSTWIEALPEGWTYMEI